MLTVFFCDRIEDEHTEEPPHGPRRSVRERARPLSDAYPTLKRRTQAEISAGAAAKRAKIEEEKRERHEEETAKAKRREKAIDKLAELQARMEVEENEEAENFNKKVPRSSRKAPGEVEDEDDEYQGASPESDEGDAEDDDEQEEAPKVRTPSSAVSIRTLVLIFTRTLPLLSTMAWTN